MNPWLIPGVGAAAIAAAALVVLRTCFSVIRVRGGSMRPTFSPGDLLLASKRLRGRVQVGAVVILQIPGQGTPEFGYFPAREWLIKRVSALPGDPVPESVREAAGGTPVVPDGMLTVSADNPDGTDSRQIGFLLTGQIRGLVLRKIAASDSPVK